MNSFYTPPPKPDEIFHYGMPQRSGRYPWGSGGRPYQRLEAKAARMENRLKKRFARADRYTTSKQKTANKNYERAVKKSNSIFFTKKSEQRAFDKTTKAQRKVNREEYRMSKYFQRYSKTFDKMGVVMDAELKKKGLEYYDRVLKDSKLNYQISLSRRVGLKW